MDDLETEDRVDLRDRFVRGEITLEEYESLLRATMRVGRLEGTADPRGHVAAPSERRAAPPVRQGKVPRIGAAGMRTGKEGRRWRAGRGTAGFLAGVVLAGLISVAVGEAQYTPEPYYDYESPQVYDTSQIKAKMYDEKGRPMPPPPSPDFESYDPASGNWYDTEGGVWYNQKTQTIETLPYGKPPRQGERKARGGAP